ERGAAGAPTGRTAHNRRKITGGMMTTRKPSPDLPATDAEWQQRLSPSQYTVMRCHGTEPPGTSPLNAEKRAGEYLCAGCGQALFESDTKFESGTGWPSFFAPIAEDAVATTVDRTH